jgi:hypothetical protein
MVADILVKASKQGTGEMQCCGTVRIVELRLARLNQQPHELK